MTFGFQACPAPSVTAVQIYTGLQVQNRGWVIKSWTNRPNFGAAQTLAALLSILLRKGLIADWEFIEELRKI